MERSRSLDALLSKATLPGKRMAPNPIRLTVRSPSCQVPEADAATVPTVMCQLFQTVALTPCQSISSSSMVDSRSRECRR
jgi:hypothetical protein